MDKICSIVKKYKNTRIVLYGLGTETERVIKAYDNELSIVGLLDGFRHSGVIYGKKILDIKQLPSLEVSLIIVVARPGSCRAIVKRIREFCISNYIELIDVRGNNLLLEKRISFNLKNVCGKTKRDLIETADLYNVVSFDLFDTLVMRRVFSYLDVFELMEFELKKRNIIICDFLNLRIEAEKELSRNHAPDLQEIYEWIIRNCSFNGSIDLKNIEAQVNEFVCMEYEIDKKTMVPRTDMVELYCDIIKSGKKIYITTDTYYHRNEIECILRQCGINGYNDLIISCEYGKSKQQGLFNELNNVLNSFGGVLHIGNDDISDIEAAGNCGMQVYKIYGADELFDATGGLGIEEYMETLSDRIKIGMFISGLFNSPFQFEDEKDISISDAYEIGYLICAPIITDFVYWFKNLVDKYNVENILFSARDGYLIQRLYEKISQKESVYFFTSRIASIRAGVECKKDIEYVDSMKYSGKIKDNLYTRFGIKVGDFECDGKSLHDYLDIILEKAKIQKKKYMKYIDSLDLKDGDTVFFDFVAKGTVQLYIERLIEYNIKGLYFLQLEPEFMKEKGLDIEPFYDMSEVDDSVIYENYYILETLLTAFHPQILEFDTDGRPVYAEETRSKKELECIERMQKGVIDYFEYYSEIVCGKMHSENKKLDEVMLGMLHGIIINDDTFDNLNVEDPFFNRNTKVRDLI